MDRKITEAQQKLLECFDYEQYRFTPKGKRDSASGQLESMGLLEGRLELASHNRVAGTACFKRAYRRVRIEQPA